MGTNPAANSVSNMGWNIEVGTAGQSYGKDSCSVWFWLMANLAVEAFLL